MYVNSLVTEVSCQLCFVDKHVLSHRTGKVTVTHLATGDYEVQDVECQKCSVALGWTYLKAFNEVCTPNMLLQPGHGLHYLCCGTLPMLGVPIEFAKPQHSVFCFPNGPLGH